jgi:hypothetical protein
MMGGAGEALTARMLTIHRNHPEETEGPLQIPREAPLVQTIS